MWWVSPTLPRLRDVYARSTRLAHARGASTPGQPSDASTPGHHAGGGGGRPAVAPPCVFVDLRPVALPDLRPPRLLYPTPVSRVVSHPGLSSTCFNRGIVPRRGIVPAPIGRRSIAGSIGSPMINCRIHRQSLFAAIGWVLRHLLINSVNEKIYGVATISPCAWMGSTAPVG